AFAAVSAAAFAGVSAAAFAVSCAWCFCASAVFLAFAFAFALLAFDRLLIFCLFRLPFAASSFSLLMLSRFV
ncbi:hypothetical protein, partial [Thiolapillus sp.]|uniref:hypothetical protein n=1 Tax=Thiolapillus sp. TaxID=2017437 RepID=UPI003AF69210